MTVCHKWGISQFCACKLLIKILPHPVLLAPIFVLSAEAKAVVSHSLYETRFESGAASSHFEINAALKTYVKVPE